MKLLLEKRKSEYCKNIEEIDNHISSSFFNDGLVVFNKLYRSRNKEKLIIYYLRRIKELEEELPKESSLIFNDETTFNLAQGLLFKIEPSKIKVGLALPGGGARGAYQMGVLSILEKEGLLNNISTIVGTSIGAFSMVFYQEFGIEKSKEMWCQLDSKVVLTKNKLSDMIAKKAVYSREKTIDFLNDIVEVNQINKSPIEMYIQAMTFPKLGVNQTKINDFDKTQIVEHLIATSSLPIVFGFSNIDGKCMSDSGVKDNDGIDFLIKQGCNIIIYISLQKEDKAKHKAKPGISIIDFGSCHYYPGLVKGLVDFYPNRSKYKIEYGEQIASLMIKKLKSEGIYEYLKQPTKENYYKLKPFYRLDKTENTIKFKF